MKLSAFLCCIWYIFPVNASSCFNFLLWFSGFEVFSVRGPRLQSFSASSKVEAWKDPCPLKITAYINFLSYPYLPEFEYDWEAACKLFTLSMLGMSSWIMMGERWVPLPGEQEPCSYISTVGKSCVTSVLGNAVSNNDTKIHLGKNPLQMSLKDLSQIRDDSD